MNEKLHQYYKTLENNFFGWWLVNFRVSVMVTILLVGYWILALLQIPKESSPEIKFGLIAVTTVYPGTNPIDMDQLITTKLEDKINDLQGIDTINSNSSVGVSSIIITLKNETNTKDFLNDLKSEIDKVVLPTDAKDPIVSEISTANQILFEIMLYGDERNFTMNHLRTLAFEIADNLRWQGPIVDAQIGSVGDGGDNSQTSTTDNLFDIEVLIDDKKMQQLGLTIWQISQSIRAFNNNIPLGNHELGTLHYDYRIRWKISTMSELMNIPIGVQSINGPHIYIRLSDIALIQRNYKDTSVSYGGIGDTERKKNQATKIDNDTAPHNKTSKNVATKMVIFKANRSSVFTDSKEAKALIEKELTKPKYQWVQVDYTMDLSEVVIEDYKWLAQNAWQSILLIFLIMRVFIGLKQSIIATVAMPLSFFVTFIFLNQFGYTLNFLTNFSLILTFWMGIDTVIVIIEASYELMKKWFNAKTAVLLALKQYAKPNITSSLTNIVVFLPMLALPGIVGKFLAYIPITIFVTLAASLLLASSINNALFWKVNDNQNYYYKPKKFDEGEDEEVLLSAEDKELLLIEQQGKKALDADQQHATEIAVWKVAHRYSTKLHRILEHRFWRRWSYRWPVVGLILTFILLSPRIGFTLFPSWDNEFMNIGVTAKIGSTTESLLPLAPKLNQIISDIPELRNYSIEVRNNTISISIRLVKKSERERNSFEVQEDVNSKLAYLNWLGYKVESKVQEWGPPAGKAIGIQLIADDTELLSELKSTSLEFENFLKSLTGTTNVSNSSKINPWQFEFTWNNEKLAELGLTPQDFQGELLAGLLGQNVGTLTLDKKDRDIVVKYKWYSNNLTPEVLLSTVINTRSGPIMLGSVAEYSINQSLNSVTRKDGDLTITVESDLEQWEVPTDYQPKLIEFAQNYNFPEGISYKAWGENEANAELIQASFVAFAVAIFLTFVILIYQFNSFKQSVMILYTIITALLGVNIGLFVTWNPYSMPFMIGFISLTGIVVNNAIFIIDKINSNLALQAPLLEAIVDAGKTRFKPVIISSLTTVLGIVTLAFKDEFWAWLAWTVVFGLLFATFMTLVAIPNIYYSVYKSKVKKVKEVKEEENG